MLKIKRVFSLLLTVLLCVSLLPAQAAFAAETDYTITLTTDGHNSKISGAQFYMAPIGSNLVTRPLDTPLTATVTGDKMIYIKWNCLNPSFGLVGIQVTIDNESETMLVGDIPTGAAIKAAFSASGYLSFITAYFRGYNTEKTTSENATDNNATICANNTDGNLAGKNVEIKFLFTSQNESEYTVTIEDGLQNGTAQSLSSVLSKNDYQLTATPNAGYMFDYWEYSTDAGNTYPEGNRIYNTPSNDKATITETVTENRVYRAVFTRSKLVLDGDPWLYPIAALYEPLGVRGLIERTDAEGEKYSTFFKAKWYDEFPNENVPIVGGPAELYVRYDVLGSLLLNQTMNSGIKKNGVDLSYPTDGAGHYIDLALYAGETAEGVSIISCENLVLLATAGSSDVDYMTVTGGGGVEFQFIMPETEYLTARIQLDDDEPLLVKVPTGQSAELIALGKEFNTLDNLKWRYLIDYTLQKASTAVRDAEGSDAKAAVIAGARSAIEGYIAGTNNDYITVSFDGNIVRVKDKDSQEIAMMAALEQRYPRERGFWYLDGNGSAFGTWVNGAGGRLFTENELSSGILESDIVTPTHRFSAGEPLPTSGRLLGPQSGGLTYGVNNFFANFGISGWRCSDGDRFVWGMMSGDDGIPDWDEEGGEVWRLAPDFTGDATVQAAFAACAALDAQSSEEDIIAARAAFNKFNKTDLTFWNPQYAQSLFKNHEPYKGAYEKLLAAERAANIGNPLPEITHAEALAGALARLESTVGTPVFGNEWKVMALARGGITPNTANYYDTYYAGVANYVAGKGTGKLDENKSTDNSRLILALSSIGRDATSVGGHDLTAPFADRNWVVQQGLNGAIFALLALDTNGYEIPDASADIQATREGLIEHILNAEITGGGWSLTGVAPADVDMTAMALQALAPYYRAAVAEEDENPIIAAADAALDWLKTKQDEYGGFVAGMSDDVSTCSTAQVVTALAALGIPQTYEGYGWTKEGGRNPVTALLAHYNEAGGWFGENDNATENNLATEQAAYALVAYDRFVNGQNPLYDMRDAFGAPGQDKTALEIVTAANYTAAQADVTDIASAKSAVEAIINALNLNGVTAEVTDGTFTAATAGTVENTNGTNGSYTFTVTLNKGEGAQQVTNALTLTITATAYVEHTSATVSFRLVGDTEHGLTDAPRYTDWIPARSVTVESASPKVYDAFMAAIDEAGLTQIGAADNYVRSVTKDGVTLAEFGNGSKTSGWKYFVNGQYVNKGLSDQTINDGDAIIWHYTNDYPAEDIAWPAAIAANPTTGVPTLTGITIKSPPNLTAYTVGDALNLGGLAITAAYGNGVTADIPYGAPPRFGVSHANNAMLDTAGTTRITVTYQGQTASFDVTVAESSAPGDKTALNALIAQADQTATDAAIHIGVNPGQYPKEAHDAFVAAIRTAQATADDADATQAQVNNALAALQNAIAAFQNAVVPEAGSEEPPQSAAYAEALAKSLACLRASVPSPGFGTSGGEWTVLALARGGYENTAYYDGYLARVLDEIAGKTKLDENKSTENARAAIALTAIGLDASNVGGTDLVSPLTDTAWAGRQGINGTVFALIALDTKNYLPDTPARQTLVNAILDAEIAGGGWSLDGVTPNADVTAMTLQALAPYKSQANAQAAINRAAAWLDSHAIADSEGMSQTIVAYSALGIDAANHVTNLLNAHYDEATGGFTRDGAVNAMATDQAAYALVAYDRFKSGRNALYDMNDAAMLVSGETPERPAADKTALNAEIARAEGLSQDSYTEASFANMQTALAAAKSVAANADATQKAADDAKNALTAATNGLKTATGGASETARRYATIGVADPGAHDGQTSVYYGSRRLEISDGETAYSLLQKTGLKLRVSGHPEYAGVYVEAINNFGEFDDGENSGWMYSVNGRFPNYSSSLYYLEDGDVVRWLYTRDLGKDIDAGYAIGGDASSSAPGTGTPAEDKTAQESGSSGAGGGGAPVATVTVETAPVSVASDGKATTAVTTETVTKAVEEAVKTVTEAKAAGDANAVAEIKIVVKAETPAGTSETAPAVRVAEADIPAEAIKAVAAAKDIILTVESDISTITFDKNAVAGLAAETKAGETLRIVAEAVETVEALNARQQEKVGDNPAIDLAIYIGNKVVRDFKGTATVSVPYEPPADLSADDNDLLTVYFLDDDGNISEMKGARYDAKTGLITFTTTHLSKFFVSEWISPFADIAKGDWFYRAARFSYSNGLISGVTDTAFAPQTKLSRAMLITILAREAGTRTSGGATWYAKATEWGVENGITDGTDMTDDVTREQFAAILYRYAKLKGGEAGATAAGSADNLSGFADAESVSDWALDAMAWATAAGLLTGRTETELAPAGTATRAEAATLLQRYIENIA
jgi:hypothetical protein